MTESNNTNITKILDKHSKRIRHLTSVQVEEVLKKRLNQNLQSHVVYLGDDGEDLQIVRAKLQHTVEGSLQIRNQKIYEIRRRLTKMDVIKQTIRETLKIMREKDLVQSNKSENDLFNVVFNLFLNGSEKKKFRSDNNIM